jgi:HEAT repeat protein
MARSALVVALLLIAGCGSQVSPDSLAEIALNESLPAGEREKAISELVQRGPQELLLFRKVAAESKTPSVRAAAFQTLGKWRDLASAPMLLAACEDPDPLVRGRAGAALAPILSENFHFRAEDPLPMRQAKLRGMRKSYENLLLNPEIKKRLETK